MTLCFKFYAGALLTEVVLGGYVIHGTFSFPCHFPGEGPPSKDFHMEVYCSG